MKRTITRLMLLAITCVAAAGCEEPTDAMAQAAGFGSWRGFTNPDTVSIGTWPTPERPNYLAIDTVPLPD